MTVEYGHIKVEIVVPQGDEDIRERVTIVRPIENPLKIVEIARRTADEAVGLAFRSWFEGLK